MPGSLHGRKFRLVAAAILILLALTCYFCWEILYQERVILNILRMSKTSGSANEPKIPLGSDHLEEVIETFFEEKKREVMKDLRSNGIGVGVSEDFSREDIVNAVKAKLKSSNNEQ